MGGLTPKVIDVPIVTLDESRAEHQGPLGRVTALKNAEVTHYVPPSPGVQQQSRIEQREGFVSMSSALRSAVDGTVVSSGSWANPELLAALDDQLVSVCGGVPRVFNGASWTHYGDTRVVSNKLSQSILHTSSHTIQAPDSAWLGGVTCFVWAETIGDSGNTPLHVMVGFRADSGAWIRTPTLLFSGDTIDRGTARVVTDGSVFWVFYNTDTAQISTTVYDTNGVALATTSVARNWVTTPGYWDVVHSASTISSNVYPVKLAQPASFSDIDVGVQFTLYRYASGTITTNQHTDATIHCNGPVAWSTDTVSGRAHLAVCGHGGAANARLWAYDISVNVQIHEFGPIADLVDKPDAITGWVVAGTDGIDVRVAVSILSNFSPPAGPLHDPGLRYVRVYSCDRSNVVVTTKQANSVLLQSRAFQIDTDWYAITYYQSGSGLITTPAVSSIAITPGDFFYGAPIQDVPVVPGDFVNGAQHAIGTSGGHLVPSQQTVNIAHNAGDSLAADGTWTFLNATAGGEPGFHDDPYSNIPASFGSGTTGGSGVNSFLVVTGSAIPGNNSSWKVVEVISPTQIRTAFVSLTGSTLVPETLAGVTAHLTPTLALQVPAVPNGEPYPGGLGGMYNGGTLTISGSAFPANNSSFAIAFSLPHVIQNGFPGQDSYVFLCVPVGGERWEPAGGLTAVIEPDVPDSWFLATSYFDDTIVGDALVVEGASVPANLGSFTIDSFFIGHHGVTTTGAPLLPELFSTTSPPTITTQLAATKNAYQFHLQAAAFDVTYIGAFLSVSGALRPSNDGIYVIVSILSATDVICTPATGAAGQLSQDLDGESIHVSIQNSSSPGTQPCWFLTPLSIAQPVAGRWEYGIAFADWRFDGNSSTGFDRNGFPLALPSIARATDGLRVVLPFRAESFTSGQVIRDSSTQAIGFATVSESTVGLKLFSIANAHGQAAALLGELLMPGMMATSFTAGGFHEDGIGLGFEKPFTVSQTTDSGNPFALTAGATYIYVFVAEVTDENGDRIFAPLSPALSVTLIGTHNTITLGGRLIAPTNRIVGISGYRTAVVAGVPTVQHYKITDDLDVNGAGFTFTSVNGGTANDTWQFVDQRPDAAIVVEEQLYTDKGFIQRLPAPAFSQGFASWKNRAWVIGYDGAIWMSGEKTEGDAVWFHPAFRYLLPTDDRPVALCAMDEYLLVFCGASVWYIPAATFPGANGQGGVLPTPVQLTTVNNGCTGFAIPVQGGVAYSSTAGGVWLITRQLTNVWLSQPVRDSLTTVTGMAVDGSQRLFVATGTTDIWIHDQVTSMWWQWVAPTAAQLAAVVGARAVYQDAANVCKHTPGVFADTVAGVTTGIAPDVTFASLSFAQVRAFSRMWALQVVGVYKGPHRLNAVLSYPDDEADDTTYRPYTPSPTKPYVFEINPQVEETSSFGLRLFVDFVGVTVPGNSLTLELISCEVGIEPGLGRIPPGRRFNR